MRPLRHLGSRTALLLSFTAAVGASAVVVETSAPTDVVRTTESRGGTASRGARVFGIQVGSVTGLYPGGRVTVPVRYSNPFPHRLSVRSQQVRVTSSSSACPEANVDLTQARKQLAKRLVVPARKSKTLKLVLMMVSTAPDACQGVRFTTVVRAQGRKK